ncbi:MAG TPA: serine/threonine-protein kinase, partial [Polyangiaceae bacterium]|nr:serine/threonine-protein kinase [Polyangiaceae bacterium]
MDATLDAEPATQRSAGGPLPSERRESDRPPPSELPEPSQPAEPSAFPRPGDVIDETYLVVSEIGRGSMGIVLSAFDQKLERTVAIKLVRAELLDDGFRQRFLHEARVMAQINHPNVVCIHALGEYRSHPYFVMELVEGTNLEQWQRQCGAPVQVGLALEILSDVCLGVSAIHTAGAVHRDLKPSNILLDWHLRSRVADFGVSTRTVGSEHCGAVGTPGYMPPEVVLCSDSGSRPLPRSDVYSLACIAYELLTGVHPFRRAGVPLHTLVPPLTEAVPLPSVVRPELGTAFDRVLLQGLEWDVAQRTPSVEAFRVGLLEAHRHGDNPDRIVVAEDDKDFRELIGLRLQQEFPGADIECVADGVEALHALERKPASVAVIDLQMPTMDGVAL